MRSLGITALTAVLLAIAACATIGPAEVRLGTRVLAGDYLQNGSGTLEQRRQNLTDLADALDAATAEGATGSVLDAVLQGALDRAALNPDQRDLAEYVVEKLSVSVDELQLPLKPEHRALVQVAAGALRDKVSESG